MSELCTKPRRLTRRSLLALFAAFAGGVMMLLAAPAAAGPLVDPSTLEPEPPNAVCREDGRQVICDTFFLEIPSTRRLATFSLSGRSTRRATTAATGRAGMWMATSYDGTSLRAWMGPGASRRRGQARP